MTIRALDVSNYSGECDFTEAYSLGIRHIVVRLSTESPGKREIAVQQLRAAQEAGMTASGYTWPYFDQDAYDFADKCMQIAVDAEVPLKYVWLDLEGTKVVVSWCQQFYYGIGEDQPVGIYTSPGWWKSNGGPTAAVRSLRVKAVPLWLAHYDDVPKLRDEYLPLPPWKSLAGKQYHGTTTFAGILCDLSVFGKRYA